MELNENLGHGQADRHDLQYYHRSNLLHEEVIMSSLQ
jgi:hypothetical protein